MLSFNPIMVNNYAASFNCTPVGRASDSIMAPTLIFSFSGLGSELLVCCLAHQGSTGVFLFLRNFSKWISVVEQLTESVSPRF